jgi:dinuclear metal center YbgI/SA1388 family protein
VTTVKEIESFLDMTAPKRLKMDFDNVGFLVGEKNAIVSRILVALDITPAVVAEALRIGAQCIVSHHPVIFRALKRVTDEDTVGEMIIGMIRSGISAVCMHTNLDLAPEGVNDMLARKLGLTDIEVFTQKQEDPLLGTVGLGRIGRLPQAMMPELFCAHVRKSLGCKGLRFVAGEKKISRIAVGGGRCGDLYAEAAEAGCEAFVTSDVTYDEFQGAKALGLTLIDAGHFPTENTVVPLLLKRLKERFPKVDIQVSAVHSEVIEYL